MDNAIELDSDKDYKLSSPHSSVWITVGSVSVFIIHSPTGVNVQLYPLGNEYSDSEALDEAYVTFEDNENLE